MSREVDEFVRRTRAAQGLPPAIEDPQVLRGIRGVLSDHARALAAKQQAETKQKRGDTTWHRPRR